MSKIQRNVTADDALIVRNGRHLGTLIRDKQTGEFFFLRGVECLGCLGDLDFITWWLFEYGFAKGVWPRDHEFVYSRLRKHVLGT